MAMQISEKYGLVYVITKLGLLFVYDLATATAVRLLACSQLYLRVSCAALAGHMAVFLGQPGTVAAARLLTAGGVWDTGVQEPYQPGPYLPDSKLPYHRRLLCHQQVTNGLAAPYYPEMRA